MESGWMRLHKDQNGFTLFDNSYKLIYSTESDTYELYDLLNDPSEKNNIAGEYPEVLREMKQMLQNWLQSTRMSRDGADYRY